MINEAILDPTFSFYTIDSNSKVLNKNQYDPFSPPIVFQGSAVVVRFGIYIESMSNFQTSTMVKFKSLHFD